MNDETIKEILFNLNKTIENGFVNNKEEHFGIMTKQDKTNGSVRALQLWRSFIVGGLTVVSMVILPLLIYYLTESIGKYEEVNNRIYSLEKILTQLTYEAK